MSFKFFIRKFTSIFLLLSFILSCSVNPLLSVADVANQSEKVNLYKEIAKENLKALTEVNLDEDTNGVCSVINEINDKGFQAVMKAKFEKQLHPDPAARRRLIYSLLSTYENSHLLFQSNVLDKTTWQDLEILSGPRSNSKFYLAAQFDRTVTEAGRVSFYRKLVSPLSNIEQIENQQAIVKEFLSNEALFNEIDEKLKVLVDCENIMLSFWEAEDLFVFVNEENRIKLPFDSKVDRIKKIENYLNKSPILRQSRSEIYRVLGNVSRVFLAYGCIALPVYALSGKDIVSFLPDKIHDLKLLPKVDEINKVSLFSMMGVASWMISKACENNPDRAALDHFAKGGFSIWHNADQIYWQWRNFWEKDDFGKLFYSKVMYIARYINNLKSMAQLVAKNEELAVRMPAIKSFNTYLGKLAETSKDMEYLLELLDKKTFDGKYSSWFMYWGRVCVAFKLISELKENFVEAMLALGELDAQLSIAKLYKEFQQKKVTFCFPEFIDPKFSKVPSVQAVDFWNPFIASDKVVPSSLLVGEAYANPQNVIITGPNAGGKSTITKAFVMAVILAQSLGIAPAKELTLTPFSKIITYLNITDDIAAGNSHFKAGVLRAQDVTNLFENLKKHEFGLAAIDEVFNGTTFKEGQAAAYSFIKMLGENPLGICITNTHFPIIPTLEKSTSNFLNYKVTVIEKPGEKIQYPYHLERGISDQIVTLKILKEEGFDDAFLEVAQQVLDGKVV